MYGLGFTTLKDLLTKGGSIAESGPAPEEPMTVELVTLDEFPPPTPNPEFVKEVVKPKPIPPPPLVQKPVIKPEPRPNVAPNAHGEGKSQNVAVARVGSSGLPSPSYPYEALARREGGTVGMEVVFGPDGSVQSATILESSGVAILDVSTRNFIYGHWKKRQPGQLHHPHPHHLRSAQPQRRRPLNDYSTNSVGPHGSFRLLEFCLLQSQQKPLGK